MPPVTLSLEAQDTASPALATVQTAMDSAALSAEHAAKIFNDLGISADELRTASTSNASALGTLTAQVIQTTQAAQQAQAANAAWDAAIAKLAADLQFEKDVAAANVDMTQRLAATTQQATTAATQHTTAIAGLTTSYQSMVTQGAQLALGFSTIYQLLQLLKSGVLDAVGAAAQFETNLVMVQNAGHLSAEGLDQIRLQLLQINPALGSSTELAGAYAIALRESGSGAAALQEVTQGAILAKAAQADLTVATTSVAQAMVAFGKTETDAAHIADVLYVGWNNQRGSLQQFQQGLAQVAPLAAGLNITMDDMVATLAALSDAMKSPQAAAFTLQTVLATLTKHHLELAQQGINVRDILSGGGGLTEVFRVLAPLITNNSDEAAKLGIQGRALGGVLALVGTAAERNTQIHQDMARATGQAAAAQQNASLTYQDSLKQLAAAWTDFTNTALPGVIHGLSVDIQLLKEGVVWLQSWTGQTQAAKAQTYTWQEELVNLNKAFQNGAISGELYEKARAALDKRLEEGKTATAQQTVATVALTAAQEAALKAEEDWVSGQTAALGIMAAVTKADKEKEVAAAAATVAAQDRARIAVTIAQQEEHETQAVEKGAQARVAAAESTVKAQERTTFAIQTAAKIALEAAKQDDLTAKQETVAAQGRVLAEQGIEIQLRKTMSAEGEATKGRDLAINVAQQLANAEQQSTLALQKQTEAQTFANTVRLAAAQHNTALAQSAENVAQTEVQSAHSRVQAAESVLHAAEATSRGMQTAATQTAAAEVEATKQALYTAEQAALTTKQRLLEYEAIQLAAQKTGTAEEREAAIAVNTAAQAALAEEQRAKKTEETSRQTIDALKKTADAWGTVEQRTKDLAVGIGKAAHDVNDAVSPMAVSLATVTQGWANSIDGLKAQIHAFEQGIQDLANQTGPYTAALSTTFGATYKWEQYVTDQTHEFQKAIDLLNPKLVDLIKNTADAAGVTNQLAAAEVYGAQSAQGLAAAYTLLGAQSDTALKELAQQAVTAFTNVEKSGGASAAHLKDIWINDVVPKIIAAYGTVPPAFAELNRQFNATVQANTQATVTAVKQTAAQAVEAVASVLKLKPGMVGGGSVGLPPAAAPVIPPVKVDIPSPDVTRTTPTQLRDVTVKDSGALEGGGGLSSYWPSVTPYWSGDSTLGPFDVQMPNGGRMIGTKFQVVGHFDGNPDDVKFSQMAQINGGGWFNDMNYTDAAGGRHFWDPNTEVGRGSANGTGIRRTLASDTVAYTDAPAIYYDPRHPAPDRALDFAIDFMGPGSQDMSVSKSQKQFGAAVGFYQHGTPYVPYDMLAMLHQGERVVPAAQNTAGGGVTIHAPITIQLTMGAPGSPAPLSADALGRHLTDMGRVVAQELANKLAQPLQEALRRNITP